MPPVQRGDGVVLGEQVALDLDDPLRRRAVGVHGTERAVRVIVRVLAVVPVRVVVPRAVGVDVGVRMGVRVRGADGHRVRVRAAEGRLAVDRGVVAAAAAGRAHGGDPSFRGDQAIAMSLTRMVSPLVTASW